MKTIGILGGMGPGATILFYEKIIKSTPAEKDQDHFKTIIYSNPKIPDRTQSIQTDTHEPIKKALKESAQVLERAGADFIAIPCNTAHYWHADIQETVSIPVLHMIDELGRTLTKNNHRSVGLLATLGTIQTNLYQTYFKQHGIDVHLPSEQAQNQVMDAILEVKSGRKSDTSIAQLKKIINELPTNIIILGCTELPFLISTSNEIYDPMDCLVNQIIDKASNN